FFQAEDGIRDATVTGVQTCALPISHLHLLCGPAQADLGVAFGRRTASLGPPSEREAVMTPWHVLRLEALVCDTGDDAGATRESQIGRASCREGVWIYVRQEVMLNYL